MKNILNFNSIEEKYGKNVVAKNKGFPPYEKNKKPFFGFNGVVLEDILENKILCNVCGKWFKSIGHNHLKKDKNLGLWKRECLDDYRDLFGYLKKTKFNCSEVEKKLINAKNNPAHIKRFRKVARQNWVSQNLPSRKTNGQQKSEYKNKVMCCQKQIIHRIKQDYKRLGRTPKAKETSVYSTAEKVFGSWNNALKVAGLKINLKFRYTNDELISYYIAKRKELGRPLKWNDFRKGMPARSVYSSHFGNNFYKKLEL